MDPSQQNMYYNSWWNSHPNNSWHMDPHKTGSLNQPPPAHNVSAPSQYPPPQGMPMAQVIPSGYNLPKPAHTGSSMTKTTQGQGMQTGGQAKIVSNMPEKSYPMMPPKSVTPPNHSPISAPVMPKMPQIPSLIPSVSSKAGCMTQPQQPYQQFQQRLNPQLHFQPQTAQQNMPMHANQSQVNTVTHNMPPYQQAQSQKMPLSNQSVPMSKQDPPKGPTPPIPDLISITKPAASQPLPASPVKTDFMPQQTSAKTVQSVTLAPKETQKINSSAELQSVSTVPQTVHLTPESKPLNSPAPIGKMPLPTPKSDANKSVISSDPSSIPKKPDMEAKEPQEVSVSDKSDKNTSICGMNLNGVPPKSQLKVAPAVLKSNESSDSKPIGQKMPAKNMTIPTPKISPSSAVPSTKPPVMPAKPAGQTLPVSPLKSSQPITKPVVTPPKTVGAQAPLQPTSAAIQGFPKSAANTLIKPSAPTAPIQHATTAESNVKSTDTTKLESSSLLPKQTSEEHLTPELKTESASQKTENISLKITKGDVMPLKIEAANAKTSKAEITPAKASKMETSSTKIPKIDKLPPKVPKENTIPAKISKKDASPKTPKVKLAEGKKSERSTRAEVAPKTPAEGDRRSKRTRNPAQVYQSPAIELAIRIPKSLTSTPQSQEKLICFFKNEHVAVRNADGTFYICQLAQNVKKATRKLKIRWLSPNEENDTCELFKPDYYDTTDFDCILTSVRLEKVDRSTFRLPPVERERIMSILHRALDKEKGIDSSRDDLAEDHPDGLDISLYNDEAQLKQKKSKRSPRSKRAPSEETTDEDSEEMKDLNDDSEESEEDKNDSESEEDRDEPSPPPAKVRKTPARRTARGGREKAPAKKELEPVKTPAPPTPSTRKKRSAAVAAIADISTAEPPAKVARTLRQAAKTPAKQSKPIPKVTRRTRK